MNVREAHALFGIFEFSKYMTNDYIMLHT